MVLMSMMMLVRMVMGLRQRSSFLWHLLGPAGRHNATPSLLQRPKNSRGSVAEQTRVEQNEAKSSREWHNASPAPPRGEENYTSKEAITLPGLYPHSEMRCSQKLAKKQAQKKGLTS